MAEVGIIGIKMDLTLIYIIQCMILLHRIEKVLSRLKLITTKIIFELDMEVAVQIIAVSVFQGGKEELEMKGE